MNRLESLTHIRESALFLMPSLLSENVSEVLSAQTQLGWLVERFYKENENSMAPGQYEAAKKDFEYFLVLVELAIEHERAEDKKDEGE